MFSGCFGQFSQALGGFGVLGSAAIIEDADLGALFLWMPHALGQL